MEKVRGILMLLVGAFALYRGIAMLGTRAAWPAIGLGAAALALGVWRLMRKPPERLR